MAGWVRVPRGCCSHDPCATHVMCCARRLCFADPGNQSLRSHPLGGRRPGRWEGDVHKALPGTMLACCYPLLAHVPQPVTSPALQRLPSFIPWCAGQGDYGMARFGEPPGHVVPAPRVCGATEPACVWLS